MTPAHPRQIILDTETTGFYHSAAENPDRLIEFAGLEMINRQLTENTLHLYIHPQRDIPAEAAAIHGITLDQLEGKPVFAQVAQQIFDFLKGAELIIHNAKFDIGFLNAEFARVGLPPIDSVCSVIDTLEMARNKYPGQKNNLDALCNRLGVDRSRRVLHGALIDCELLGGVYHDAQPIQPDRRAGRRSRNRRARRPNNRRPRTRLPRRQPYRAARRCR